MLIEKQKENLDLNKITNNRRIEHEFITEEINRAIKTQDTTGLKNLVQTLEKRLIII